MGFDPFEEYRKKTNRNSPKEQINFLSDTLQVLLLNTIKIGEYFDEKLNTLDIILHKHKLKIEDLEKRVEILEKKYSEFQSTNQQTSKQTSKSIPMINNISKKPTRSLRSEIMGELNELFKKRGHV